MVQSYHNISKNAIKSQHAVSAHVLAMCAKLPQYFKECNQVTTAFPQLLIGFMCKVTTIFQRMQSSHNHCSRDISALFVQSYHNISKNAIKSQLPIEVIVLCSCAKLPQYFKECNQVTTHKCGQQNFAGAQNYHNISKNAIKSQLLRNLHAVFVDGFAVTFGISVFVVNIPAKRFSKGADEIQSGLRFVIIRPFIKLFLLIKPLNKRFFFECFFLCLHCRHDAICLDINHLN